MNPATIIQEAQADGVTLALSPSGTIKAKGDSVAVKRWLTVLREHKASIIQALKVGDDYSATVALTDVEERAIRAWLECIGETELATITEVLNDCRRDSDARAYFLRRAAAEKKKGNLQKRCEVYEPGDG